MSNLMASCCCACCETTSYSITTLPSISYTMACGTNGEYPDTGATTFNLNSPTYGVLQRANVATPIPACYNKCYWFTPSANYQYSGAFYPRCSSGCGQTWSYYNSASVIVLRDSSNAWRARIGIGHTWYTTATGSCAVAEFSLGCYLTATLESNCPAGTYTITGFTNCNGISVTAGTYTAIPAGGPTVTWGTPSGTLVLG